MFFFVVLSLLGNFFSDVASLDNAISFRRQLVREKFSSALSADEEYNRVEETMLIKMNELFAW